MKIKLISSVMLLTMLCLLAISAPVEARSRTRVSFNVNSGTVVSGPRVYAADPYRPYYSQGVYVAPGYAAPGYYAPAVVYDAPQPYCAPVVYQAPQPYYYSAPVMVAPAPQPVVGGGVSFSWRSRR